MRRKRGIRWLVAVGMLAGCQSDDFNRPPTVHYGEESCASCRMIISDERFAAAIVTTTGDAFKFDDIGCLIQHEAGHLRPNVAYWVHEYKGHGWVNAHEATFIHSPSIVSPMGHGLAALVTEHAAKELATRPDDRTLRFSDLPGFVADSPRENPSNLSRPD
jgi:copper chaperone NosL